MIARKQLFAYWLIAISLICLGSTHASAGETRIEAPLKDGGKAIIYFTELPLKTMTEIPFSIELYSPAQGLINDATLQISLTMPSMPMPPNHPHALWVKGAYRGHAVFTMAGAWQVEVEIERPEIAAEKVTFAIEKVIMQ